MKISIIGLGLIGSSLAYQLKQKGHYIRAYARSIDTINQAFSLKLIDEGFKELGSAVQESDIIIVCVPIEHIAETVVCIDKSLKKETIVIDVGSVKDIVMKSLEQKHLRKALFVGAHPMAGSEKTGIDNFIKDLFAEKPFIFTYPNEEIKKKTQKQLKELANELGAIYLEIPAHEHDKLVATISHLPYFLAVCLFNRYLENPDSKRVASTGFRDTSRVAHSDPMWGLTVALANSDNIVGELSRVQEIIEEIKKGIVLKDTDRLLKICNIDKAEISADKINLVKKQIVDYH